VAGLAYLGRAAVPITQALHAEIVRELGELLEGALAQRAQEPEARIAYEAMLQRTPLRQLHREKLMVVLKAHGWNKSKTAEALGCTRATLYVWLNRYGIARTR
jgi:transcriptional regulator of acetoin/glycerol metabolism